MHTFDCMIRAVPTIKAVDLQRIGVSKPYSHQLISGDRTPSLKLAIQIEQKLGVPTTAWPLSAGADHAATLPSDAAPGALEKSGDVQ